MDRNQINRRLRQLRAAAERNIRRLIPLREIAAPIHSEIENLIECRKLLVLSGENEMRVRLHHPADALLPR